MVPTSCPNDCGGKCLLHMRVEGGKVASVKGWFND
ncbi:MAG: hypothetical protein QXO32_08680 [Candidatus Bathyarchaeia archaeon]